MGRAARRLMSSLRQSILGLNQPAQLQRLAILIRYPNLQVEILDFPQSG